MSVPRRGLWLALFLILGALPARATVILLPDERRPVAPPHPGAPLIKIERLTIDVSIDEGTARTTVHEVVRNVCGRGLEARFVLPIPRDATVHGASLKVGNEWIEAEVLPAEEARRAYRDIVRRQIDPALIEYLDDGLLRTHVFPIPAGTTREIRLELTTALPEDFDAWVYRFPLRAAVGTHPIERVELNGVVRSSRDLDLPYSPTHQMRTRRGEDGHFAEFDVSLRRGETPRDLQVFLASRTDGLSIAVASTRPPGDDGFVMLRINPGRPTGNDRALPRRVVFALDVSGSMKGEKLDQAKRALRYCLESLHPRDRFALLTYEASVRGLTDGLVPARRSQIERALDLLERETAGGGTNLAGVVQAALASLDDDDEAPAYVLLLSDGKPTVGVTEEKEILELAEDHNQTRARLFTFGVGTDLNARLMDELARRNHATPRYVLPDEDLEVALTNLANQIAEPLWTDLELDLERAGLYDLLPGELGDLFRGETLTVLARYRDSGTRQGTLRGHQLGRRARETFRAKLARSATTHSYLPRLWASRKIAQLQTELRHRGRADQELIDAIVDLGTRYGILTEYTSFIMREEEFHASGDRVRLMGRQRDAAFAPNPAGSVEKAARESRASRAQSLSDADAMESRLPMPGLAWDEDHAGRPTLATGKRVAGRFFQLEGDGVWVQAEARNETPRLTLAPGSDAYFQLIEWRPDLRELLAAGHHVRIVLGGDVLAIEAGGKETIPTADRKWLQTTPR